MRRQGRLLLLTPNLRNYVTFITELSPGWFQKWFVENILHANPDVVFSTYYQADTPRRLHKLAGQAGLCVERMELVEGTPNLLSFSSPTFLLGVVYERLVSHIDWLSSLHGAMLVVLRKE